MLLMEPNHSRDAWDSRIPQLLTAQFFTIKTKTSLWPLTTSRIEIMTAILESYSHLTTIKPKCLTASKVNLQMLCLISSSKNTSIRMARYSQTTRWLLTPQISFQTKLHW